jgi:hypothetical protein
MAESVEVPQGQVDTKAEKNVESLAIQELNNLQNEALNSSETLPKTELERAISTVETINTIALNPSVSEAMVRIAQLKDVHRCWAAGIEDTSKSHYFRFKKIAQSYRPFGRLLGTIKDQEVWVSNLGAVGLSADNWGTMDHEDGPINGTQLAKWESKGDNKRIIKSLAAITKPQIIDMYKAIVTGKF